MDNSDREKEKWNNQKHMGKRKFVLIYGVLLWGGCGSLLYSVLTIIFSPNLRNYSISGLVARFVFNAIIFGLCGIIVGITQWNFKSKKFDAK